MLDSILVQLLVKLIRFYQKTFSPDHGVFKHHHPFGYCRFRPTCSDYTVDALNKYGVIKGGLKASYRILRCNPWNKGGWDPINKK